MILAATAKEKETYEGSGSKGPPRAPKGPQGPPVRAPKADVGLLVKDEEGKTSSFYIYFWIIMIFY